MPLRLWSCIIQLLDHIDKLPLQMNPCLRHLFRPRFSLIHFQPLVSPLNVTLARPVNAQKYGARDPLFHRGQ